MKKYLVITAALLLVGCQTFYSSIVTVTEIRKSVMNEYGVLWRAGQISEETDKKILVADAQYLAAARSMELALIAYKAGTSTNDPSQKLLEVKEPVKAIITIITPLIGQVRGDKYNNNLNKATQL